MPGVSTLIAQPSHADDFILPQNLPLFLPSAACAEVTVPRTLLDQEWRLREAQAYDALTDLRGHLEVRAYIYGYKDQHVRGQREGLRSNDIVEGIEDKLKVDKARYRVAYSAMTTLAAALGKLDWRGTLQPLNDADVRHVAAGDGGGSESRKELSWVWTAGGMHTDGNLPDESAGANLQEGAWIPVCIGGLVHSLPFSTGLRVEWCKARSRAMRWTEEVELLQEEMRRTQEYHRWRAAWWEHRVPVTQQQRADIVEGMRAYAHRQASIRRQMRDYCTKAWTHVRAWVCLGQEASDEFESHLGASLEDDSVPSLYSVSESSVASLQAALQADLEDVADIDRALEDFD